MAAAERRATGARVLRVALPGCLLLIAFGLALGTRRLEAYSDSPFPVVRTPRYSPALAALAPASGDLAAVEDQRVPVEMTLAPGETVSQVLDGLGLGSREAQSAILALREHVDLRKLRAGDQYVAYFDRGSNLTEFRLAVAGSGRVLLERHGEEWESSWDPYQRTIETHVVRGRLDGSLEGSMRSAGAPEGLAYEIADVLQWDLDFTRDLRLGDEFEVAFEELFLDGQYSAIGRVLAVRYENRGRAVEAYVYGDGGEYYDGEGRPLEKLFLRSPLRYTHITSRFSQHRFHPILKKFRPHYGVDYGAPVGTPVRVTANGAVTFVGWDGGGGKAIKVRHPNGYLTAYLHLSRFASGLSAGRGVRQGDVIGFVGQTGLATGPHLDYRVQYQGRWLDPLSLKSVPADPIGKRDLPLFAAWRDALRASLASGQPPETPAVLAHDPSFRLARTSLAPAPPPAATARR